MDKYLKSLFTALAIATVGKLKLGTNTFLICNILLLFCFRSSFLSLSFSLFLHLKSHLQLRWLRNTLLHREAESFVQCARYMYDGERDMVSVEGVCGRRRSYWQEWTRPKKKTRNAEKRLGATVPVSSSFHSLLLYHSRSLPVGTAMDERKVRWSFLLQIFVHLLSILCYISHLPRLPFCQVAAETFKLRRYRIFQVD